MKRIERLGEPHTTNSSMLTAHFRLLRSQRNSSTGAPTQTGRKGSITRTTDYGSSAPWRCGSGRQISRISSRPSSRFREGVTARKRSGRRLTAGGSKIRTSASSPRSRSTGNASSPRCVSTLRLVHRRVGLERRKRCFDPAVRRVSGRVAPGAGERWQTYLTDDEPPEIAFYCPECAEREFGGY